MKTIFKNSKLDWCKDELKVLLQKLNEGTYQKTAETVFNHVAHTGVESDLDPELKQSPSMQEFLSAE